MQGKVYRYIGTESAPFQIWRSVNPSGEAWWFGWSETEMCLPQRLNGNLPDAEWERLSIFNDAAELRILSRGNKTTILLTETMELSGEWSLCERYSECESSQHMLLGDPPVSGGKTSRLLDVAYPASFDYGIELAPSTDRRHRVVAEVRHYYDDAHRLRYVRYAGINPKSL